MIAAGGKNQCNMLQQKVGEVLNPRKESTGGPPGRGGGQLIDEEVGLGAGQLIKMDGDFCLLIEF